MDSNIIEKTKEKLAKYENRHENILSAAIKLFNENGYPGTTTASIAKEAGVTERTMYRHYKNKQVLFRECIFSILGELMNLWQEELDKDIDDNIAYLKAIAGSYVNFVLNNPDKTMFLVHLYSYRGIPEMDEAFKLFVENRLDDAENAIKTMQEKGIIKNKTHPRILAGIFIGQYFTMVFLNEFMPKELFNADVIIELAKSLMQID
jgi:AcrR family transcriptional regulator